MMPCLQRASGRALVAAFLVVSSVSAAREARAANPKCAELVPAPIIGVGGSAQKLLFKRLGSAIAALPSPPYTLVYASPGACFGVDPFTNGTKLTGSANYWNGNGTESACDFTGDESPSFGSVGNSGSFCAGQPSSFPPPGVGDFLGPVQSVNFIVPKISSQEAISAAAVYFAYGFGANVPDLPVKFPWNNNAQLIRRNNTSFVQIFVALASGLPISFTVGVDARTNDGSVSLVASAADPQTALGFAASETADANRDKVRTLAYQHYGQSCGYWPDSTVEAFDKRNVRNGQYYLWSPMHFYAKVNDKNEIIDPKAAEVIGYFTGEVAPPGGVDIKNIEIKSFTVPKCAMEVWRKSDLGPIESYAPTEEEGGPCGCFFESVATGTTSCTPCNESSPCPESAPKCRYGYCEVN